MVLGTIASQILIPFSRSVLIIHHPYRDGVDGKGIFPVQGYGLCNRNSRIIQRLEKKCVKKRAVVLGLNTALCL